MSDGSLHNDVHKNLHSEAGARPGEHPGRSRNPIIKAHDVAWLEFDKPDLAAAETFGHAFGFLTALRTDDELQLRGTDAGTPCVVIRRAANARFVGPTFAAADRSDVRRLADATGASVRALPETLGGVAVDLVDPSGLAVRVAAGMHQLAPLPSQEPHQFNFGQDHFRINASQRPPRVPARVQRLGHVVWQTTKYTKSLNWFLDHLGLLVSDFHFFPNQRNRGPVMSFNRCDRGTAPADHHTLALTLGPANRYVHSAYQVCDLDAMAAGGQYLAQHGYRHSWGIGRHIQGSQLFDYWRDPDGFLVEHFTDGDLFDCTLAPGWGPLTASGLSQWGPTITKDFLGTTPGRDTVREIAMLVDALRRKDNEFDLAALRGLFAMANS